MWYPVIKKIDLEKEIQAGYSASFLRTLDLLLFLLSCLLNFRYMVLSVWNLFCSHTSLEGLEERGSKARSLLAIHSEGGMGVNLFQN